MTAASNRENNRIPVMEAIKSPEFLAASGQSALAVPLGTGADGAINILDLCRAPHLLIAGSVMSGKREFVNSVIASLAISRRPHEVSLILDDVTRVELPSFNGLPHLIRPVVININESIEILHWLENETNTRRQIIARAGAVSFRDYNQKTIPGKAMPYLVAVIYELADLMVEFPGIAGPLILKIAGFSPEAGIHMVIATQRPAPDIITNALKACFITRACFNVVAAVDSRTVLDADGAERLPENSDMLFLAPGERIPRHLRGFNISYDEIDDIVSSFKKPTSESQRENR